MVLTVWRTGGDAWRPWREQVAEYRSIADPVGNSTFDMKIQIESTGAGAQIRTADLRITNALLYQLSYTGDVGA